MRSRSWLAPLLIVPMLVAFVLVGAQVGVALGVATVAGIIIVAARAQDRGTIEAAGAAPESPHGILVLALVPIEDPRAAGVVAAIADPSRSEAEGGVLVLSPARSTALDRWASDLEQARFESQRVLTVSVATLAAAGIEATGLVADSDPVLAVEDALRSYVASEVIVVADGKRHADAIDELEERLDRPLRRVIAAGT